MHEDVRKQYENSIRELLVGDHPERIDVKRIKGKRNDYYRIRIGSYRVIYTMINGSIVVINTMIAGSRGDIYKKCMERNDYAGIGFTVSEIRQEVWLWE